MLGQKKINTVIFLSFVVLFRRLVQQAVFTVLRSPDHVQYNYTALDFRK